MKILKKHGKKVSVMLLAIALMISPMLPIVKAADNDTCEKNFHYYFLLAEEAYIDNVKNTDSASSCTAEPGKCTISRQYSNEFLHYFGFNESDYNKSTIWPSTQFKQGGITYVADGGASTELNSTQSNGGGPKVTGYDAYFYNKTLPAGYKQSGGIKIESWDDLDWQRYAKMYVKNFNVATSKLGESDVTSEDGNDVYFIHYQWKESDRSEWYDSKVTHALNTMFTEWGEYGYNLESTEVQNVLERLKKASYDVNSTVHIVAADGNMSGSEFIGSDEVTTLKGDIERSFGTLDGTNKEFFKYSVTADDGSDDTYAWYFFPKKATIKFTASGDACNTNSDPGVIDTSESSTNNPGTGIVSYAIIGTLLVGAASAYIYARKNNKFNKV